MKVTGHSVFPSVGDVYDNWMTGVCARPFALSRV